MLLTAQDLLARGGVPSRDAIREHISGNYCRCTGYQAIVDAVEFVAQARAGKSR
jgi:carbon-monoxide dehydrogenase small subunit